MSDETIVMSKTAATRLENRYDLDPMKISVVPHGATPNLAADTPIDRDSRPVVLTWGLIGPGKGLETAIEAFADLTDLDPLPRYVILGKTHPKVQAAQGDAYLDGLRDRAHALGLDEIVEFDGRYLDLETLSNEVRKADMVLLPYESTEQVTSGVLVEAIAAGKPVVATAFPHAVEMLSTGAGTVVPHSSPIAMSGALRAILANSELADRMARTSRSIGSTLYWPAVAGKYDAIASRLISRPPSVAALTDARKAKRQSDDLARVG
jgi:glycosyltransferase involved in cell wall biosynthesis